MSERRYLGLDLDGLRPSAAVRTGAARHAVETRSDTEVPPAALLGSLPGERAAADLRLPCDSRGTGLATSESAGLVEADTPAARFPLVHAWERFLHGMRAPWSWGTSDGTRTRLTAAEAVATVGARILGEAGCAAEPTNAVVVPDCLLEQEQSSLLMAFRRAGIRTHLLWRPVAAALSWLQDHGKTLKPDSVEHHDRLGWLLHLHLAIESCEASCLALVAHDHLAPRGRKVTRWILPGRMPADPERRSLLTSTTRRLYEATTDGDLDLTDAERWNLLWTSTWGPRLFARAADAPPSSPPLPPWFEAGIEREGLHALQEALSRMDRPVAESWDIGERAAGSPDVIPDSLTNWLRKATQHVPRGELVGAVVTGPLASARARDNRSLAERSLERIGLSRLERVLVEDPTPARSALLAKGAALFARRKDRGEPTYLDTLPIVETIAIRNGEPDWINILESEEAWVMGGKVWHSTPAETRFRINKGEEHLSLSVHRQGIRTCRRVASPFEQPLLHDTGAQLSIEMSPGQGNPTVEVEPADRSATGHARIYLDWETAEDTGRTRQEELDAEPRICPQAEPRVSSAQRWARTRYTRYSRWKPEGVRGLMAGWIEQPDARWPASSGATRDALDELVAELRTRDVRDDENFATALSSDGLPTPEYVDLDHELIEEFCTLLWKRLQIPRLQEAHDRMIRCLAWTGNRCREFERHLKLWVRGADPIGSPRDLTKACGHVLSDPTDVAAFCNKLLREGLGSEGLESLARILMYRADALRDVPPDHGIALMKAAQQQAEGTIEARSFKIKFRRAALVIVYLLRMRRYHDDFLAPKTPLHHELRSTFLRAQLRMQESPDRVMGGSVDIPKRVDQIIDYLDRRGRGRLVAMTFDDG